jgi:hypothetical protein
MYHQNYLKTIQKNRKKQMPKAIIFALMYHQNYLKTIQKNRKKQMPKALLK